MQRLKQQLTNNFHKKTKSKLAMALLLLATGSSLVADGGGSGSLKTVPVPTPPDMANYVTDSKALVVLGKALFWDMQTGSDGKQACASCHFHAGADHRSANQLNPNGAVFTANQALGTASASFPFHSSQVAGSAGEFTRTFTDVVPGNSVDAGFSVFDPTFNLNGVSTRRVTGRNTPSIIDAVFNVRNLRRSATRIRITTLWWKLTGNCSRLRCWFRTPVSHRNRLDRPITRLKWRPPAGTGRSLARRC